MSRSRRRSAVRARMEDDDETVGLAGWMYTDMLLGLVVVFLGSISIVIPVRALVDEPDDEGTAVVATTTSTTTTTAPIATTTTVEVAQCPRLFISEAGRENPQNGIWVEFPNTLRGPELGSSFDLQLAQQLAEEPGLQQSLAANPRPPIGLAIGAGWYDASREDPGAGEDRAKALLDRLVIERGGDFESTILRPGGRRGVRPGYVGIEIYPIVVGPCS